jgi:hypothetical protein
MAKDIQDQSWSFTATGTNDNYNSWQPNGPDKTFSISVADLGGAPTVVLYAPLTDSGEGSLATLDSPVIGAFDGGSYSSGELPLYVELDGSSGVGMVKDSSIAGFTKDLGQYTEYLLSYDMGVPVGKVFAGASAPLTMSLVSSLKMAWICDGVYNAIPDQANNVISGWTGSGWILDGNQSPHAIYTGAGFTFDKWNGLLCHQKAGADPRVDNGLTELASRAPSNGTTTKVISLKVVTDDVIISAAARNPYYTHIHWPAYCGNGDLSIAQHAYRNLYLAVGANSRARVEIGDNADYTECEYTRVIPHAVWSGGNYTSITVGAKQRKNMTHWHFTKADGTRESGVITWN